MSENQNLAGRTYPSVDGTDEAEAHVLGRFEGESEDIFRRRLGVADDEAEDVEGHVEPLPRERDELV
jgi:hypothetical protein